MRARWRREGSTLCLRQVLRLDANDKDLNTLVAEADDSQMSSTISFIGPTHEGKSFLIRLLMNGYGCNAPHGCPLTRFILPPATRQRTRRKVPTLIRTNWPLRQPTCAATEEAASTTWTWKEMRAPISCPPKCKATCSLGLLLFGRSALALRLFLLRDEIAEAIIANYKLMDGGAQAPTKEQAVQQYYELRRNSVREHLPRLAYGKTAARSCSAGICN